MLFSFIAKNKNNKNKGVVNPWKSKKETIKERKWKKKWDEGKKKSVRTVAHRIVKRMRKFLMERRCCFFCVVKSFSLRWCRENFSKDKENHQGRKLIESVYGCVASTCVFFVFSVNERQSTVIRNREPERMVFVFSKAFLRVFIKEKKKIQNK